MSVGVADRSLFVAVKSLMEVSEAVGQRVAIVTATATLGPMTYFLRGIKRPPVGGTSGVVNLLNVGVAASVEGRVNPLTLCLEDPIPRILRLARTGS